MGQITLGEQAAPATPSSGITLYTTVATPSIARVKDDGGSDYALALLEKAQSFTAAQTIAPTTDVDALIVNMPAGATTGDGLVIKLNGTEMFSLEIGNSTGRQLAMANFDNGTDIGRRILIRRNSNGSTPASGHVALENRDGGVYRIWPDNTGVLRILGGADPTNANDTAGTVVGAQTSMAEAKLISDDLSTLNEVMARIRQGAAAVRRFTYRSGHYGGEQFEGVVTDYAPEYGADRDADHPQGRSLNEITIPGDLLRFAAWAMERIEELTKRVVELEA